MTAPRSMRTQREDSRPSTPKGRIPPSRSSSTMAPESAATWRSLRPEMMTKKSAIEVSSAVRSMTMSLPFLSEAISTTRCASSAASAGMSTRSSTTVSSAAGSTTAVQPSIDDQLLHVSRHKVADGVPRRHPAPDVGAAHVERRPAEQVNPRSNGAEPILQSRLIRQFAAGPRPDDPLDLAEEPIRIAPRVDLGERVGRHDQEQPRLGVRALELDDAVDRVGRAGAFHLDRAQLEGRIATDRQTGHEEPIGRARDEPPA